VITADTEISISTIFAVRRTYAAHMGVSLDADPTEQGVGDPMNIVISGRFLFRLRARPILRLSIALMIVGAQYQYAPEYRSTEQRNDDDGFNSVHEV
jgi:hypothetical protein